MKKLFLILTTCLYNTAFAQSPGLIVNLTMDSVKAGSIRYELQMKRCEPVNGSAVNGYFTNEKSTIDFKALTEKDVTCGAYIDNYEENYPSYNFRYGNQVFAWEKIIVWKIMNASSRDWQYPMYIILPVKIKSFVTSIKIKDIEFQSGKVIWLDDEGVIDENHTQQIVVNLNNVKGIDTDSCTLKKILD